MTTRFPTAARRGRLARRHALTPGSRRDDVVALADDLVAVHSTDPATVYLSLMARMERPDPAAVERALYTDRALVRHHSVRRTLWVASRPMTRRLHSAATLGLLRQERRRTTALLADNGIDDPERWIDRARQRTLEALAEAPLSARELGRLVPELNERLTQNRGKKYEVAIGAHTRVLLELGMEGAITRARPVGSWINGQYTWTRTLDWLGEEIAGLDVAAAERELVGAYLRSFGPVTTTDVRWWAGWTAATARRALAAAGAVAVETDDGPAWVAPGDETADEPAGEWVALLPSLDSTLMGWKERAWYLPASSADAFDSIGNGGPTVWVDGVVVGAWAQRPDGEIRVHWFRDVPAGRRAQVADRARELEGWLGETRFTARFPGAITASLLA